MRAPLPLDLLLSIRLSSWHALFSAVGYPPGITAATDSLDAILTALRTSDLDLSLARALFRVPAFAIEGGRTDIYDAADALGIARRWPEATSPADLIVLVLAEAAKTSNHELLDAAQILRDRHFRPLARHVYVGSPGVDANVGEPTQYENALRARFAAWSATRDFGSVDAVLARLEGGVLHYEILHEDRPTSRPLKDHGLATDRRLRAHRISYGPATRRLSITTDCMEAVTPLATLFGEVLFNDARHFLDEPSVVLWPLQERGPESLEVRALAPKVAAKAIGGTWHSGKNHAITPRGRDFFKALARYKIRIEGGRLDLVTLRATVASSSNGPTRSDIALRPPHLVTVAEPELEPLLSRYLDAAKLTSPAPRIMDFFTLQPWVETAAAWIASEGEEAFAFLVSSGMLVPDPNNRSVASPNHPHAGRLATAYRLRDDKFIAWSADPTIAPFVVLERDLVVYALSFAKLAAVVAEAMGLEGPAAKLDDDGVLHCGRRALGPTHVHVYLLTRPIRPATARRLMEAAGHGHPLLITPEGRMQEHGLRQIAMPKLAGPWQPLLGAIVRALHVESFVDTTIYAPAGARIVLHRATQRVWIDGLLCAALNEIHFRLLEILITHAGPVHTKDIAEHVAQGSPHEDTTRKAIESLAGAIDKSFKGANARPPKDLRTLITKPKWAHYALAAKGFVD